MKTWIDEIEESRKTAAIAVFNDLKKRESSLYRQRTELGIQIEEYVPGCDLFALTKQWANITIQIKKLERQMDTYTIRGIQATS